LQFEFVVYDKFSDAKIKIKTDKPNTTIAFFSVKDYVMHKTLFKGA